MGILTNVKSQPLKNFILKFGTPDYVRNMISHANVMTDRFGEGFSPNT